ncbi:hypothetical protein TBLA_0C03390 [Henningerozyma blattae CBS 6284]|uniref:Zn(2)-C6 fungal-type domain-containing protein n=1 Tax=Henningerozyma blattae (strain ATCC 34711 / CBS 6284 / DSM 70876 / NBRC 10599 / NRRL Y-10934 / UCD 77-7) TaxID=1071380 RepID=I2H190_HENB6|nr:hypothetical protein TBLA_0C03390 [Tetrapisispora blattae CBS 6284]CCH60142.1 hypothetical protein TBLA_0C03390 [Tetrapisispora blattae CBS 6284]
MQIDSRGRRMRRPPACVQCRRRKIGCDRARPVCGNCAKNTSRGECIYPDVPGQIDYSQFPSTRTMRTTTTTTTTNTQNTTSTTFGGSSHNIISLNNNNNNGSGSNTAISSGPIFTTATVPGAHGAVLGTFGVSNHAIPLHMNGSNPSGMNISPLNANQIVANTASSSNPLTIIAAPMSTNNGQMNISSNNQNISNNVTTTLRVPQAFRNLSPDVASMSQIAGYNTRLQLLNGTETLDPSDPQGYLNSLVYMNWLGDNTAYDLLTSPHTQDEVLKQELEFLKGRLGDLEDYAISIKMSHHSGYPQDHAESLSESEGDNTIDDMDEKDNKKRIAESEEDTSSTGDRNINSLTNDDRLKSIKKKANKRQKLISGNSAVPSINANVHNVNGSIEINEPTRMRHAYENPALDFESRKFIFTLFNQKLKDHTFQMTPNSNNNLNIQPEFALNTEPNSLPILITQIYDTPNTIFNWQFLVIRDWNLLQFFNKLTELLKSKFKDKLLQWKLLSNSPDSKVNQLIQEPVKTIRNNNNLIKLPSKLFLKSVIEACFNSLDELDTLLPMLNKFTMLNIINKLFDSSKSDPTTNLTFKLEKTSFLQQTQLGQISLMLLIFLESLYFQSTISGENQNLFQQLLEFGTNLQTNLSIIQTNLTRKTKQSCSYTDLEELKFISLLKYYKNFSILNEELFTNKSKRGINPPKLTNELDLDEDINLAIFNNLNNLNSTSNTQEEIKTDIDSEKNESEPITDENLDKKKDKKLIEENDRYQYEKTLLWNFIFKNYSQRHLIKGETPILLSEKEYFSNLKIVDTLLKNDISLINIQIELVKYLSSKTQQISVRKMKRLTEKYKSKLNDITKKSNTSTSVIIHNITDSLIYCNSLLYINYYNFLHWEQMKDYVQYTQNFSHLIEFIEETLIYIFTLLSNHNCYTILYFKSLLKALNTISLILLSVFQRNLTIIQIASENPTSIDSDHLIHIKNQSKLISTIFKSTYLLLQNYNNNKIAKKNPKIVKYLNKLQLILSYMMQSSNPSLSGDLMNLHKEGPSQLQVFTNGLKNINTNSFVKINAKLRNLIDSLKNLSLYNDRNSLELNDLPTWGLNENNLSEMYDSLYSW